MRSFLTSLMLFSAMLLRAQTAKMTLTAAKQEIPNLYTIKAKVNAGSFKAGDYVDIQQENGEKTVGQLDMVSMESAATGQTAEFALYCYQCKVKPGQLVTAQGGIPVTLPATRAFDIKVTMAFLTDKSNQYFVPAVVNSGKVKVGDSFEFTTAKGKKGRGKILKIQLKDNNLNKMYPSDVATAGMDPLLDVETIAEVPDTDNHMTYVSPSAPLPAPQPAPVPTEGTSSARQQVFAVNAIIENATIRLTAHNLIQYFPRPEEVVIGKINPDLNYYIWDVSVENKTNRPVDAGDYLLRLNFFTPDGKSADEFGRLFKNKDQKGDEVSQQADAIDKNIFGGSSALTFATIAVAYQSTIPNFDSKPCSAIWEKIAAGQRIRCRVAKAVGVPKNYTPAGIGTWVTSPKNYLFVPIKL